jgi:hypothetical protein
MRRAGSVHTTPVEGCTLALARTPMPRLPCQSVRQQHFDIHFVHGSSHECPALWRLLQGAAGMDTVGAKQQATSAIDSLKQSVMGGASTSEGPAAEAALVTNGAAAQATTGAAATVAPVANP